MWMRGVLEYYQNASSSAPWSVLYSIADQHVFNLVLKMHPERLCLLSNDYNFQFTYIGHNYYNHDPPGLLRKVMSERGHSIAILHGTGEDFLHDHSIKRYLWLQFIDRRYFSPEYRKQGATPLPVPDELSPSERAQRLSRESVVKYLQEWTGVRQVCPSSFVCFSLSHSSDFDFYIRIACSQLSIQSKTHRIGAQ